LDTSAELAHTNLEPTAGFEPATRFLQISRQLNSARDFRFPSIPRTSIASKEFHWVGYKIGYSKSRPEIPRVQAFNTPGIGGYFSV
jgi:hypothetical protein